MFRRASALSLWALIAVAGCGEPELRFNGELVHPVTAAPELGGVNWDGERFRVAIMNAWIREAHPDAPVNGGYMTLVNVGSEDVILVGLESPAFEKVELHEMAMVDGLMKMRELTEVVVPAGGMA
ncbi:MAG: copper chaperone PCu(A)C, partial [Thermoanaerobaculia bacterium]